MAYSDIKDPSCTFSDCYLYRYRWQTDIVNDGNSDCKPDLFGIKEEAMHKPSLLR